jgi:hypothetical protein
MPKTKTTCKQREKDVRKNKQREKQTMATLEQKGKNYGSMKSSS